MEQWLYENLIVVLLAGFSGFEIVRRLIQAAWSEISNVQVEALITPTLTFARRTLTFAAALFATQTVVGRFAKEQVSAWPEPYLTDDMPADIEFDRQSDFTAELKLAPPIQTAPVQLRLCGSDCSDF